MRNIYTSFIFFGLLISFPALAQKSGTVDGHDYVDLGLSVKWATCCMNALSPYETGEYFAWGALGGSDGKAKCYSLMDINTVKFKKYVTSSGSGVVDGKTRLEPSDDVAFMRWGNAWRIPTKSEVEELVRNCDVVTGELKGKRYFRLTSRINGNFIIIPSGGICQDGEDKAENYSGIIWSSDLHPDGSGAYALVVQAGHKKAEILSFARWWSCAVRPVTTASSNTAKKPELVDLGLSVRWASWNLGASAPEKYGDYYAWGETKAKAFYVRENYKWYQTSEDKELDGKLIKYNDNPVLGKVDNMLTLQDGDDAAHVILGGGFRIPTYAEWQELFTDCTWTKTSLNGVPGYNVRGRTGKSIFLPCAGYKIWSSQSYSGEKAYYWSSRICNNITGYPAAYVFDKDNGLWLSGEQRHLGYPIRPVSK